MTRAFRSGLPRTPGGEPWPSAPNAVVEQATTAVHTSAEPAANAPMVTEAPVPPASTEPVGSAAPVEAAVSTRSTTTVRVRRGLPREPGGAPWPLVDEAPHLLGPTTVATTRQESAAEPPAVADVPAAVPPTASNAPVTTPAPATVATSDDDGTLMRRGLPRTPGGEPWPSARAIPAQIAASTAVSEPVDERERAAAAPAAPAPASHTAEVDTAEVDTVVASEPHPAPAPSPAPAPARTPRPSLIRRLADAPLALRLGLGAVGLLIIAGAAVLFVRWLLTLPPLQDFLVSYPGETELPEGAPVGFPAWLAWQHFFNVFLIVLIIRSGLRVRTEQRPTAFWTPRWSKDGRGKISLNLWFHQALDILWLTNGIVFVVLLIVTGQWMRVVPTSWEVFPNALSAVLQYVSLDWPTENGWVNYNSLQVLAYFVTIFIAAPLAAITGARMSAIWPKGATALNRAYPVEVARALHFPVMLYFVLFIIVHVTLVLATGALRNLNHMYAAQGSTDPAAYADNWLGFWIFFASLLLIVGGWLAARPIILAPIASAFGKVGR